MLNLQDAKMYYRIPGLGIDNGIYVDSVTEGSPAFNGGMKSGDIIIKVDDKDVNDAAYLRYLLFNHNVGEKIKVTVYRNGTTIDLEINLTKKIDS